MSPAHRPFAALVMAQILSLGGTRLSMIAIPWLVLTATGDPMMTGVVVFAEMLPYVLAKALGGPFIDRLGARTVAIVGDAGSLLAVACIPLLHAIDALQITTLVPIVVVMGLMRGPADAAKSALVPFVARSAALPLERVTGVMGTIERFAATIGAAGAGALVALLGPANALTFNALTFGLSALVLAMGTARAARPEGSGESGLSGYFTQLKQGFDFLRGDAVLVGVVIMTATTNLLDQAFATVLLPVWVEGSGQGAAILGLLLATMSGASVAGSALATMFADRMPRLPVYAVAFLITGFPRYAIYVTEVPLVAVFAVMATAGFASGFLNPILSAVLFERIPEHLVGRVSSLVSASTWSTMAFGGLVAGAGIAALTLPGAFAAAGLVYLGATMMPLTVRSFRAFSERPEPHRVPAPGE